MLCPELSPTSGLYWVESYVQTVHQAYWTALASQGKTPTDFTGLTGVIPLCWGCTGCSCACVCSGTAQHGMVPPPQQAWGPVHPTEVMQRKTALSEVPKAPGGECAEHHTHSASGGQGIASGAAGSPGDGARPWWPWRWWGTCFPPAPTAGLPLGTQGGCQQHSGDGWLLQGTIQQWS